MSLQGSSLGFSHSTPYRGHGGCWKVLCTPAGVSEHDQGAEDQESGEWEQLNPQRSSLHEEEDPLPDLTERKHLNSGT